MLQYLLHSWLGLFLSFQFFAPLPWYVGREIATVICARRRDQPVNLVNLFTDSFALCYTCCAVDLDSDVEYGGGESKTTKLVKGATMLVIAL